MCLHRFESLFGDVLIESDIALMNSSIAGEIGLESVALPGNWRAKGQGWGDGRTYQQARSAEKADSSMYH